MRAIRRNKRTPSPRSRNSSASKKLVSVDGVEYSYGKLLGKGGFFEVYEARLSSSRRWEYVLKIIRNDRKDYTDGCKTGYEKQRSLNSSGLFPAIHQIDIVKERLYVVEDLVRGTTLSNYIERRRSVVDRNYLLKRLAYSLYILHSQEILHRDLHPGNVLLMRRGREMKILDFNTAVEPGESAEGIRSPGVLIWGPYTDPSIEHNFFNKKSDIYSLGVIFAELLLEQKAAEISGPPYHGNQKLRRAIVSKLKQRLGPEDEHLVKLVSDMTSFSGLERPSCDEMLERLETRSKFQRSRGRPRAQERARGYAFIRREDTHIELFLRERDIVQMNLPLRVQLDLKVYPKGENADGQYFLLAPRRFFKDDKVFMFARVSMPNHPGTLYHFIRGVSTSGHYTIYGLNSIRGFQNTPSQEISFGIAQDGGKGDLISQYLDPLTHFLRKLLFRDVKGFLFETLEGRKIWELWMQRETQESAVVTSAGLSRKFRGHVPSEPVVMSGYLASTRYADLSNDTYAVVRGLEIHSRATKIFGDLDNGRFYLLKVIPDAEHRDIVLRFCPPSLHLLRIHMRAILPIQYSPNFISRYIRALDTCIHQSEIPWNIETFETRDGFVEQFHEDRYSVRVSTHLSCRIENHAGRLTLSREKIQETLKSMLEEMNAKSVEVYVTSIHVPQLPGKSHKGVISNGQPADQLRFTA